MNNIVDRARSVALRTSPINTSANFFFIWCVALAVLIPGLSWLYVPGGKAFDVNTFFVVSTIIYNLCYSLTVFLLLATEMSEFVAMTKRVGEFICALDYTIARLEWETKSTSLVHDDRIVSYKNVGFASPGNKLVLRNINFSVPRGGQDNLLIMGPSGVGKSSILRVLGGLWPVLSGHQASSITKPAQIGRNGITYMPQKPYLTLGTLKEQITYPDPPHLLTNDEALKIIKAVQMEYILERDDGLDLLNETQMWSEVLSGGEQQRLGIARVLFQMPAFAVLDECTSALDEDIEAAVYTAMVERGISLISIAHRSTVKAFHHRLFRIERDGTWSIDPIPHGQRQYESEAVFGDAAPTNIVSRTDDVEIANDASICPANSTIVEAALPSEIVRKDLSLVVFFSAFGHLLKICFVSSPFTVGFLVIAELCFAVWYAWGYNYFTVLTGNLTTAITGEDRVAFERYNWQIILVSLAQALANGLVLLVGDLLSMVVWNAILTKEFCSLYLSPLVYYRILGDISDPDQRIGCDIQNFCIRVKNILFGTTMYVGFVTVVATVTWFTVTLRQSGGWFCVVVTWCVWIAFTLVNQLFTFPSARASKHEKEVRSRFRFSQTYFRLGSEHVAFLNGHAEERGKMYAMLGGLVDAAKKCAIKAYPVYTVSVSYYWVSLAAGFIIPGIDWVYVGTQEYDLTNYTTASFTIISMMYNLSTLILLSQEFSDLMAVTVRLSETVKSLRVAKETLDREAKVTPPVVFFNDHMVQYNDVTFASPGNKLVLRNISLQVPSGGKDNLLIMGPSGVGKSSILRVLGGLWPVLSGTITKPAQIGRNGITYMPQKPYLTLGTLKEQITYPDSAEALSDDEAVRILKTVQMEYLLLKEESGEFLNSTRMWSEVLSGGEQQRLGIARVLFQMPAFAVLDECTSALDEDIEAAVYTAMVERGISLISIAHRSTLKAFHHRLFHIDRDGKWSITPL